MLLYLLSGGAGAAELVWSAAVRDGRAELTGTAGNWSPAQVPAEGDVLRFPDTPGLADPEYDSGAVVLEEIIFDRWQSLGGQGISARRWTFNHSGTGSSIGARMDMEHQDSWITVREDTARALFHTGIWFGDGGRTLTIDGAGTVMAGVEGTPGKGRIVKYGTGMFEMWAQGDRGSPEIIIHEGIFRPVFKEWTAPVTIGPKGTLTGSSFLGPVECSGKVRPNDSGLDDERVAGAFRMTSFTVPEGAIASVELDVFGGGGGSDALFCSEGSDFDRADLTLRFQSGFRLAMGESVTLGEAPAGTPAFRNAPEGTKFGHEMAVYELRYHSGTEGKSILLTRVPVPEPKLSIRRYNGNGYSYLTLAGVAGTRVEVESSPDLKVWSPAASRIMSEGGSSYLTVKHDASGAPMFFRAYGVEP